MLSTEAIKLFVFKATFLNCAVVFFKDPNTTAPLRPSASGTMRTPGAAKGLKFRDRAATRKVCFKLYFNLFQLKGQADKNIEIQKKR